MGNSGGDEGGGNKERQRGADLCRLTKYLEIRRPCDAAARSFKRRKEASQPRGPIDIYSQCRSRSFECCSADKDSPDVDAQVLNCFEDLQLPNRIY